MFCACSLQFASDGCIFATNRVKIRHVRTYSLWLEAAFRITAVLSVPLEQGFQFHGPQAAARDGR
jgi:hypothetical protein